MISREKLHWLKKQAKDPITLGLTPAQRQIVYSLVDSNLEALDLLDGGMDAKERERQISLALADVRATLDGVEDAGTTPLDCWNRIAKARFVLDMVEQLVKAKGTAWMRKWDWYQPRIAEEFGDE